MPELRQDIVTGRWVVIATERSKRPEYFSKRRVEVVPAGGVCPFCYGNESLTPPEVDAFRPDGSVANTSGWQVRVVPNKYPAFSLSHEKIIEEPLYCHRQATGLHEVIIHSPDHGRNLGDLPVEQVEAVIKMYVKRYQAAISNYEVRYVEIIVNHGLEAGASLEHSHSQLFALPLVPKEIAAEIDGFNRHLEQGGDCIFCDVVAYETRSARRVVSENENFIAFCPYASRGPFEISIMPKKHLSAFELASPDTITGFTHIVHDVLSKLRNRLSDPPYNYWLHTRPVRVDEFHWHLEILPKLSAFGGLEIGTGVMINVVKPEEAAAFLRAD